MTKTELELLRVCIYQNSMLVGLRAMAVQLYEHAISGKTIDLEEFKELGQEFTEDRRIVSESIDNLIKQAEKGVGE
ncbi:hypothetical protein CURE108131_20880 [Cupriavidus respiraculi]|uniref:Uncharacterized protein n=1 Tax=Cupriavidus respiraculi TaxID=195930 RepID=A0ABM8X003_9BURK|nr:hypothetical protein [Cupriavidus respiraculi]CAG9173186.1 hypothetical protein LMG21510_02178 [Cupriavidus respiraculi]